jgi:hypothetical protein
MEPRNLRFGGGIGQTLVHPIILIAVLIAGIVILFGSRNRALVAFLSAAILIPTDQILLVGSLHFPMLRVLVAFGIVRMLRARVFSGSKILRGGWNKIDIAVTVLTVFIAANGILLYRESASVVYQLGTLYTDLGVYFLLRFLIRDQDDVLRAIRAFAYVAAVVAMVMTYEAATGRNPIYGLLGGARAAMYGSALTRADRFRATASFGHPILAGTFGAILLPLFVGLWWTGKKNRKIALLGILAATVIPIAAYSSTALLGFIGGLVALCFWPLRKRMRPIRWGIVLTLVTLHLALTSPVWHLITRIDLAGGSSSYHRYQLINQCILHFNDWWLIGTKAYADWGWDMWDLSNQYVGIADPSGLVPLLAFLASIVFAFQYIGATRKTVQRDRKQELFLWAMGSALFANVVAFFGISYFDQTIVAWYALLVMIPVTALSVKKMQRVGTVARSQYQELPINFGSDQNGGEVIPQAALGARGLDGSALLRGDA